MLATSLDRAVDAPTAPTLKQLGARACGVCVRAKVKCVPATQQHGKCQRCYRLQKECHTSTAPLPPNKRLKTTHVAQLEQKLDNVVALLQSREQQPRQEINDYGSPPPQSSTSSTSKLSTALDTASYTSQMSHDPTSQSPWTSPTAGSSPHFRHSPTAPGLARWHELDDIEADRLLETFRSQLAEQFPFVVIPAQWSSRELGRVKPFTWKAIMVAASHENATRQLLLGKWLTEEFCTRLLLQADKSLDMLQGLLIHIAWYHFHFLVNPQVTNLLALCKALVTNLGLYRAPTVKDRRLALVNDIHTSEPSTLVESMPPEPRVLEEWRALAGCFYLTSVVSSTCRRMEALEYTSYLEDCCRKLAEYKEYSTDTQAMHLVLLQRLRMKISSSFDQADDAIKFNRMSTKLWLNILQTELEDFNKSLPGDIQQSAAIAAGYHSAAICLYEASLYDAQCRDVEKSQRIRMLSTCLFSVKDFFASGSASQISSFPASSLVSWTHFGYALLMAFKLSLLKVDGWDLDQAQDEIQLPRILEETISSLEPIAKQRKQMQMQNEHAVTDNLDERDIFDRFIRQMQRMKSLSMINPHAVADAATEPLYTAPSQITNESAVTPSAALIDIMGADVMLPDFDQSFWQDMYHGDDDPWTMLCCDGQSIS